jgi:hypothetical protein
MGADTGVQLIESVTMLSVDVGLFTLVLVRPIAQTCLNEQTAPVETDYLLNKGMSLPVIQDDAYLNMVCLPNGSLSGVTFIGDLKFTWG